MASEGKNNLPRFFREVCVIRATNSGGPACSMLGPIVCNNSLSTQAAQTPHRTISFRWWVITRSFYRFPSQRVCCFLLFSDLSSLQLVCVHCLPLLMRMAAKCIPFGVTACCIRIPLMSSPPLHLYLFRNFITKRLFRKTSCRRGGFFQTPNGSFTALWSVN